MEKKEYIVLINFQSINEGVNFVNTFITPFCFLFNGETYDSQGNIIQTPDEFVVYNPNEIYVSITELSPSPGDLYVENSFLKYFKEI
jgi:hypothetical protein